MKVLNVIWHISLALLLIIVLVPFIIDYIGLSVSETTHTIPVMIVFITVLIFSFGLVFVSPLRKILSDKKE